MAFFCRLRVLDPSGVVVQLPFDLCEQHARFVARHNIHRLKRLVLPLFLFGILRKLFLCSPAFVSSGCTVEVRRQEEDRPGTCTKHRLILSGISDPKSTVIELVTPCRNSPLQFGSLMCECDWQARTLVSRFAAFPALMRAEPCEGLRRSRLKCWQLQRPQCLECAPLHPPRLLAFFGSTTPRSGRPATSSLLALWMMRVLRV
jgi:hypothetical protein